LWVKLYWIKHGQMQELCQLWMKLYWIKHWPNARALQVVSEILTSHKVMSVFYFPGNVFSAFLTFHNIDSYFQCTCNSQMQSACPCNKKQIINPYQTSSIICVVNTLTLHMAILINAIYTRIRFKFFFP
jgi:hypothetical protein